MLCRLWMSHQFIRHNHVVSPLAPSRHDVSMIQQATGAMLVIITYTYRGFKWTKVSTKVAFCVNTTGTGCNLATLGNFIHTVLWGKTHLLSKPSTEFHKKWEERPKTFSLFKYQLYGLWVCKVRILLNMSVDMWQEKPFVLLATCKTLTSLHVQKHWNAHS